MCRAWRSQRRNPRRHSAEQSAIPLRRQLEQTRDLIRALAGNFPDQDVAEKFELAGLHLPQELPLSLPSRIVEQRPDVRAAEEQLHYASAQAGVAIANTLPQFPITAAVGGMASDPAWMFRSGGGFFDLTANVAYTIFDGGTLRAKSRAAQQGLIQAGAQYRSTVITALQNVADTLHVIQSDAEALKAADTSERAAQTAAVITRKQYEVGLRQLSDAARRRAKPSTRCHQPGPGANQPPRRHGGTLPGAGRRLVESCWMPPR